MNSSLIGEDKAFIFFEFLLSVCVQFQAGWCVFAKIWYVLSLFCFFLCKKIYKKLQ